MTWLRELVRRVRMLARHEQFDSELAEEMRLHRELRERELVERGVSPEEARYAAHRQFGNTTLLQEESRMAWGWDWLEQLLQDVHYGLRMLRKNPGFTAVAVLTLALGIGANTAIFSVINSVMLRPLPFKNPERLVDLRVTESAPGSFPLTGDDYLDWQAQNHTFEAMSLYDWGRGVNASNSGGSQPAETLSTQANFFSNLGVEPLLGRTFAPGEDQLGKNHIAVLSYPFWQQHFGGRSDAIGQDIALDGEAYTVIGVMPRWFNFPPRIDIWRPLDMSKKALGGRGSHQWLAFGRIKAGTNLAQARADLVALSERLSKQNRNANDIQRAILTPLKERLTGDTQTPLLILLGAVGLVLLVACANVANLMLSRSTSRVREVAVRATMGATRGRIVRQLLTESVLLSTTGAVLGLMGAAWCVRLVQSAKALPISRANPIQVDTTVLLFTLGVSVLVGVLFGLAPALRGSMLNLSEELKSSAQAVLSPSSWPRILRDTLVISEIAVSLALLVGAGLLLRSFAQLRNADIGVQTKKVMTARIILPKLKYTTLEQRREFFDRLLEKVDHTPGVQVAAVSTGLPLEEGTNGYINIEAGMNPELAKQLVEWTYITPDFFRAFGISLLQGSNFTAEDVDHMAAVNLKLNELYSSPNPPKTVPQDLSLVAVINHAMAQAFWPKQDPIGKKFSIGGLRVRIIGIVGDVKEWGITKKTVPQVYFPLTLQLDKEGFGGLLVVKTSVPPASVLGSIRSDVQELDGSLAVFHPRTMDEVIADNMQDASLLTVLLGVFAALALVLATIGIYGVISYSVNQRTHEIGIRMALGATPFEVVRMVVGEGAKLALIGVVIGLLGALALTRLMASQLYGVSPGDPATFGGVAILLSVVALAASYIPARRAMRVDPMVALRYE